MRRRNARGIAEAEIIGIGEPPVDDGDDWGLLVEYVRAGEVVGGEHVGLAAARERHESSVAELPRSAHQLSRGEPAITTTYL